MLIVAEELLLPLAMLLGAVVVVLAIDRFQRAWWQHQDRRLARRFDERTRRMGELQAAWTEEDRRLLGEVRSICEPGR